MNATRPGWPALLSAVSVAGLSLASVLLGGPPAPVPASAPPSEFSAERAMAHVAEIAQRPHPVGSPDHARVRDYLVGAIGQLGLKAELQPAVVGRGTTTVRMARVENILARIAGSDSTGAVLLASHYDSVPAAPGAADAASGVAAIIEAVRALTTGPPLRNDVILLLTDAEELGLLGARAFVEQHPWAKDVRMVMNFEARGTRGPAWMFETSAGNGAIVAEWASLVPKPAGSSLTYEVYKRLPNDTDFTEFKRLTAAGLNFAFVGGLEQYHTPGDNAAALDRGSLQHHGEAALRLTRRFASMDLGTLEARDAVYFSLPLLNVAPHYSTMWAVAPVAVAAVLFAAATIRARRRREAGIGGIVLAAVIYAAFVGASGYLGWRSGRLAGAVHERWLPEGPVLTSGTYAAAMVACIVAVWLALYVLLRKRFAAQSIALGAAFVLLVAAAVSAWFAAGASYVAAWPLLGSLLAAMAASSHRPDAPPGAGRTAAVMLLAVPAILIVWPLAHSFFVAMGLTPEGGAAMAGAAALGMGALAIPIECIVERRRWWPAGMAAITALACLAVAVSDTRYSALHPRPANVIYALDADARTGHWAVRVDRPDEWFGQFLGPAPRPGRPPALVQPWSSANGVPGFLHAEAPAADLPAPKATLVRSIPTEGGRSVTFRVAPGREGHMLSVWVNGVPALDVSVDGRPVRGAFTRRAPDDTAWTLEYFNAPASGAAVSMTLKGARKLTVAVAERAHALPDLPGTPYTPRPASLMPAQAGDQTIVRRTYTF
ncbi:MAG: M20/M25/M40 family metallo-hydrolase [Vicinamibacterales bacterium]